MKIQSIAAALASAGMISASGQEAGSSPRPISATTAAGDDSSAGDYLSGNPLTGMTLTCDWGGVRNRLKDTGITPFLC